MSKKIESFTDLIAWQKGHLFVVRIYKIVQCFPETERFGLISQMQRAAVSITSNIAEGFGRKTAKAKIHFYRIALTSLTEIQNQLLIAKDVNYISSEQFTELGKQSKELAKLTQGLMAKAPSKSK